MKLTFYGGAKSVTGANYMLESSGEKILVDCGLNQGTSYSETQNFEPFAYKPEEISAVLITHAHIDHIGRLPKLYKDGFRGKIISTPPTKDFAEILLLDSQKVLREEAEHKKKKPLYEIADVSKVMTLWHRVPYHEKIKHGPFEIEFYNAGHVLGSASIAITAEGKKVVFSGDLGNLPAPFIQPTEYFESADYVLVESCYGGRVHENVDERKDELEDVVEDTIKSGGVLMIPAFALERTQELMFEFNDLVEKGRIPRVPVFIDSPLAIKLTAVYQKYSEDAVYFKTAMNTIKGDQIFNFPGLKMTLTTEESKQINDVPSPKVVIAGAGMSQAGRILHHEKRYLSDPKSSILFMGYQAKGSLGRKILDGEKEVKIFGEEVDVNCKIKAIGGYSAHADQPLLLKWLQPLKGSAKKVFVVQGEEEESEALLQRIKDDLAIEAEVPEPGESVVL